MFLLQVRYISDCKKFYGRILDNCNVASSIQGASRSETEEIWERLYPDEPYSFQPDTSCWDETLEKAADAEKHTTYDLVLAIERQSPFFYQVNIGHDLVFNIPLCMIYVVVAFIFIELCVFFLFTASRYCV